jgi:hypothetical protein
MPKSVEKRGVRDYSARICKECAVAYFGEKCTQKYPANCTYRSYNHSTGYCVQCKREWFGSKRCLWQYNEVSGVWIQLVLRTMWRNEFQNLRCKFFQQKNLSLLALLNKLISLDTLMYADPIKPVRMGGLEIVVDLLVRRIVISFFCIPNLGLCIE